MRRQRRLSTCRGACKRSMTVAGVQSTSPLAISQSTGIRTIGKLANATGITVHLVGCLYLMWQKGDHEHLAGLVPHADACCPAEEIPHRRSAYPRTRQGTARWRQPCGLRGLSSCGFSKRAVRVTLHQKA